jgi:hypothetical protein
VFPVDRDVVERLLELGEAYDAVPMVGALLVRLAEGLHRHTLYGPPLLAVLEDARAVVPPTVARLVALALLKGQTAAAAAGEPVPALEPSAAAALRALQRLSPDALDTALGDLLSPSDPDDDGRGGAALFDVLASLFRVRKD